VKAVPISGVKNRRQFFNKIDTQRRGFLEEAMREKTAGKI